MAPVKPVPDGYHVVTPYLIVDGAARAIEFYKAAFGATEALRLEDKSGKIGHAEIEIGDSRIMLADPYPEMDIRDPQAIGGSPVRIHLYVPDVDATVKQAVAAGAKVVRPVADQFYGDRSGGLEDPFGHLWFVSTHQEDVPQAEVERRFAEMQAQ